MTIPADHAAPSLTLECDALESAVSVMACSGREQLSTCFTYELVVLSHDTRLDAAGLVGANATLKIHRGEDTARWLHGVIVSCQDRDHAVRDGATYALTLRPCFWRSSMVQLTDIQMDLTIPGIVKKKLEQLEWAVDQDFQLRVGDGYADRDFVVQYQETDLAFISRLCEHLGIFYFFEQDDDRDVVVFADHNSACPPVGPSGKAHYRERGDEPGVHRLTATSHMLPGRFIQRDYNYRTPSVDLLGQADIENSHGGGIYEYGSHVKSSEEALHLARIRAEERTAASYRVYEGESDLPELSPGHLLRVEDHPSGDLELLITEVTHHTNSESAPHYSNQFKAIPAAVPFRPPRTTPKPVVNGMLTGIIENKQDSDYADIDDQGRYRVRFLFDTVLDGERQASRPIRMMQPHTGPGYGMHFPLRGGIEVLIGFVGGDPDRPIIAGTVPNPQTASPVTAENRERNVIRTGGGNEINIDDTEGAERIKLSTPKGNTVFQLGAPNAPNYGAEIRTSGHSSAISEAGSSRVATWGLNYGALLDIVSSTSIVNAAGTLSPWAFFLASADLAPAVAKAVFEHMYADTRERRAALFKSEAEKNAIAVTARNKVEVIAQSCRDCRTKSRAALKDAITGISSYVDVACNTPVADLLSATDLDDYATACDENDRAYETALGTLQDRNGIIEVNRENFANESFEPVMDRDALEDLKRYDFDQWCEFEAIRVERRAADAEAQHTILTTAAPLANQLGVDREWDDLTGDEQKRWREEVALSESNLAKGGEEFGGDVEDYAKHIAEQSWNAWRESVKAANASLVAAEKDGETAAAYKASDPRFREFWANHKEDNRAQHEIAAALRKQRPDPREDTRAKRDGLKAKIAEELSDVTDKLTAVTALQAALRTLENAKPRNEAAITKKQDELAATRALLQAKRAFERCWFKCQEELDTARSDAIVRNEDYADCMIGNRFELRELAAADNDNNYFKAESTAAVFGMSLHLVKLALALWEQRKARIELVSNWSELGTFNSSAVYDTWVDLTKGAFLTQRMHVTGSDMSTKVYGDRDVMVRGDVVAIHGTGGKHKAVVVRGDEEVDVWAGARAKLSANESVRLLAFDKEGKARSSLTLDARKTATLLAGKTALALSDDGFEVSFPSEMPDGFVGLNKEGLELGATKKVQVSVFFGSEFVLTDAEARLAAKTIKLQGNLDTDNLTVKGNPPRPGRSVRELKRIFEPPKQGQEK